ncbi:MAG: peptide/nickel transport system permease protein [Thermomicrobiales bacterium]|jgi:peptide/nickel transport system permease protein|nr:peptide/nickel transport system permease protein [Thermomicrobiales bacterium]MEA2528495.1 peptide/nickel transport system permease protein [Thermomicrobiales bacterium]
MHRYILRRLLQTIPVLLLFSVVVFAVLRLVPGDPAVVMLGLQATPEAVAGIREEMGLDKPLPVQYGVWLGHVLRGDFGVSWSSKQPVWKLIERRFEATLLLTFGATVVGLAIAIPLGIVSGVRPHSKFDTIATGFSLMGVALPGFWLGLMLLLLFSVKVNWLPPSGYVPLGDDPATSLKHLVLPAITLGTGLAAPLARFVRSGMLDVMGTDYIRTARAKGLREPRIVTRHALRNGLLSVVTVFGLEFGSMLGGAVITESVFNWPGIGTLLLTAIKQRDYATVQGAVLFVSVIFILVNLAVDVTYGYLDPRIRK